MRVDDTTVQSSPVMRTAASFLKKQTNKLSKIELIWAYLMNFEFMKTKCMHTCTCTILVSPSQALKFWSGTYEVGVRDDPNSDGMGEASTRQTKGLLNNIILISMDSQVVHDDDGSRVELRRESTSGDVNVQPAAQYRRRARH